MAAPRTLATTGEAGEQKKEGGGPGGVLAPKGRTGKEEERKRQKEKDEVTSGDKSKITHENLVGHPGQAGL